MSQKDIQKIKELLVLVILTFGLICAILAIAVHTRTKPPYPLAGTNAWSDAGSNIETDVGASSSSQRDISHDVYDIAYKHSLIESLNRLSDAIDRFTYVYEQTHQPEPEPELTPEDIYCSYVDEICRDFYPDVDPVYVKAIIYHESRFQPEVVNSKTGVTGLMQVSPKWHTKRAANLGVTDLKDPYGNILVGCDILHELTSKYDFNYALNFFAGGYPYANKYRNSTSNYVASLNKIIQEQNY